MRPRTLTLHFQAFGARLLAIPEPTPEEQDRARRAHDFLHAISGTGGPTLDASYLMGLPEEVFQDARRIITGEATDAASQVVVESIEEDQWTRVRAELERLPGVPDPTVAPEFI